MGIWGARVVAVDDDPDTLDLVHTILTDAGASVVALSEPGLAFTTILGFMPDVLLVDIAMPGEDGLTLMRKVRSLSPERGGRIPAATLTAAPPGEGQLALWTAAGFQRHILKPFLPPALIATVNELAGREVERRRCALDRRQWPGDVSRDRRAERRGSLCLSVA